MKTINFLAMVQAFALLTSAMAVIPASQSTGLIDKPKVSFSPCSCAQDRDLAAEPSTSCQNMEMRRPFATMTPNTQNMFAKSESLSFLFLKPDSSTPNHNIFPLSLPSTSYAYHH